MNNYIKIDGTAPFAFKIKALTDGGYDQYTVCYKCTNGDVTKTVNINVR